MRQARPLFLLGMLLAILVTPALGDVLNTGIDSSKPSTPIRTDPSGPGCPILWFTSFPDAMPDRIAGLGYGVTVTANPADVNPANLANYVILVVAFTGSGVLGPAQPLIQNFVQTGHALLIHQPNTPGLLDYAPAGFGVNTVSDIWCNYPSFSAPPTIVDPTHPITSGLTDADLSGAFDAVGALGPGYHLLTRSIACGDPALAAGTLGTGRVAYEDGNGSPASFQPGSDVYWANVFLWLCAGGATPAHESTWGRLKAVYR